MKEFVIGLDIGTSSIKAVAMSISGKHEASAEIPLEIDTPKPNWREQHPETWWEASKLCLAKIANLVGGSNVKAIGLTGQMHSPAILDKNFTVIRPSILWNDGRTTSECNSLYQKLGKSYIKNSLGNPVLEGFTAPKILWIKKNEPENFKKISTILIAKDFIGFKLTGELITEPSDASGSLLMDINSCAWSDPILDLIGIDLTTLPTIIESTNTRGFTNKKLFNITKIPTGTPVIAGGADNAASAISTGCVDPDTYQISIGTSGAVMKSSNTPIIDDSLKLHCFNHCIKDTWYSMGVTLSAGNSMSWYQSSILENSKSLIQLDKEASTTSPGSDNLIFLPYLNGERTPHNNPNARGCFIGLHSGHSKAHLSRAIMEGVSFSIKDCLNLFKENTPSKHNYIFTGGGSKSDLWSQILSDTLNVPIKRVLNDSGACVGAAMLSAVGLGWFRNTQEAVNAWVSYEEPLIPDESNYYNYEKMYKKFQLIYQNLNQILWEIK
tara:strand:+ start:8032 stop:9519 length:1488 start_codon:yes stop_codon:yes gene_type:complete